MHKKTSRSESDRGLREKAEKLVSKKPAKKLPYDPEALLHELEVHQIELEMQNEELRRSQRELEESRQKYLELYDFAPVGYITLNEKGMVCEVNLTAAGLLGIGRKPLVNKPFSRFIVPESQDAFYFHRREVLKSSTKEGCELVLRKNDGTIFHAQLESIGAEVNGQRMMHTVITDITYRKRMEEELQRAHDELEKRVVERTVQLVDSNESLKEEIAKRIVIGEELKESRERLRNLTKHLQKIREQEKTFLSRELHDELGQVLTGIKMDIRWIERRLPEDSALALERLYSVVKAIDDAILSVQRISMALRPPALDDFGLSEAIRLALTNFEKKSPIACKFISTPRRIVLNKEISTEIFRIFQEALTNISRHADAHNATILLENTGDRLTMEVRDDGRGITKKEIMDRTSIGLTGMRERAYAIKGDLAITGSRGKGTIVAFSVPLTKRRTRLPKHQ
jgi:PAS domain S-box-containing protein